MVDKKTAITGLGVTGLALLEYFRGQGEPVVALEEVSQPNFEKASGLYAGRGNEFYFGELPENVFDQIKMFLISPGVPPTGRWVSEARKRGIPLLGELEFAARLIKGSLISVTGTNGKSTTVTLIQAILQNAGIHSSLKGNIGAPLITAVKEPPKDYYVVELSSYQLETVETCHSKVAIVLNVTADHLDRYDSMDAYAQAKANIALNQTEEDFFIYNADDRYCVKMSEKVVSKKLPFSLVNHFKEGAFVDKKEMVVRVGEKEFRYALGDANLKGLHNQENMLASLLAIHAVGVSPEVATRVLTTFAGLPHRVELVHQNRGVKFYDDSKGTNVGSVVMSLASFEKNVVLILGGRDKGGDYGPLKSLIKGKVKQLILMGEAREIINQALGGIVATSVVENMDAAIKSLVGQVSEGDVVLLSPACSSFDQYKNYAERGNHFKKLVMEYL